MSVLEFVLRWLGLLGLCAAAVISYKRYRHVFFWILFFLIVLAPTMIPVNIVWVLAERYVYLGAAGVIAAAVYPLVKLSEIKKYKIPVFILIGIITVALLARTIVRNNDWQSDDDLWIATVIASPTSPHAHNNMGDYYARHNDHANAAKEFKIATELKPDYGDAYLNLALAYTAMNNFPDALKYYETALKYNARLWQAHTNLGVIYYQQKNYQKASYHMQKALEYGPPNQVLSGYLNEIQNGK
jgi:tetratricopeptide (TPR) repeat protein